MSNRKARLFVILVGALALIMAALAPAATVDSNIDPANHFAWGENIGWINFYGQGTGDAATPPPVVTHNFMCGFVWGENVGWINLGDGAPDDGVAYSQAAGDTGVNVDSATGDLSGYAWGENIGWINFGWASPPSASRARIDIATGKFNGYAWGENVGWIHLNGSSTGGVTAQPEVLPPTASQIAAGIVAETPIPWGSDRQPDGAVDAADVATRVNDGFP
ncbi:hypothetical protein JXA47_00075 [Candidatus Sumerlaeota bacterium]|nr:hypothetical protein [Candidatus Sumerlaeota bacterium]